MRIAFSVTALFLTFASPNPGQAQSVSNSMSPEVTLQEHLVTGARATLLILRAALPTKVDADHVVIAPGIAVLSDEEAARLLVELAGSRCAAEVLDGRMVVLCERLSGHVLEQERRYARILGGYLGQLGRDALMSSGTSSVLIRTDHEHLVLDVSALDVAAQNFFVDMEFAIGAGPPEAGDEEFGVAWVVGVGRSAPAPADPALEALSVEPPGEFR